MIDPAQLECYSTQYRDSILLTRSFFSTGYSTETSTSGLPPHTCTQACAPKGTCVPIHTWQTHKPQRQKKNFKKSERKRKRSWRLVRWVVIREESNLSCDQARGLHTLNWGSSWSCCEERDEGCWWYSAEGKAKQRPSGSLLDAQSEGECPAFHHVNLHRKQN